MLQRIMDGITASTGTAVRLASLALGAAIALIITVSFLCAAAFILVLEKYGPVQACLAGAGIFFLLTLIAAGCYLVYKRGAEKRAAVTAKATAQSVLNNPMLVATGLQIIRAVGIKRLVPILAVGCLALGLMASRSPPDTPTKPAE